MSWRCCHENGPSALNAPSAPSALSALLTAQCWVGVAMGVGVGASTHPSLARLHAGARAPVPSRCGLVQRTPPPLGACEWAMGGGPHKHTQGLWDSYTNTLGTGCAGWSGSGDGVSVTTRPLDIVTLRPRFLLAELPRWRLGCLRARRSVWCGGALVNVLLLLFLHAVLACIV